MTETLDRSAERLSLIASDGHHILTDVWRPTAPRVLVHLFHGLGEHPVRYERFARYCNARAIAVAAHSHRGHGEICTDEELGHFADADGWTKLLEDAEIVQKHLRDELPGLPLVLLGHSMGSFVAQAFVIGGYGEPDALILSGSSRARSLELLAGHWLAGLIKLGGRRRRSPLLNKLGFGEFNRKFAPNRTEFDWLSRDEAEVDKYVDDRLCGAPSSAQLWFDLTGGVADVIKTTSLRQVPPDLPLLITGGAEDPVGGRVGMQRLADAYEASGHENVTLKIYDGARHEMFNEVNREHFFGDVVSWIESTLTRSG